MHKISLIKRKHFGIVLTLANAKNKNIQKKKSKMHNWGDKYVIYLNILIIDLKTT